MKTKGKDKMSFGARRLDAAFGPRAAMTVRLKIGISTLSSAGKRRPAAALQGAFGTKILRAVIHARRLPGTRKP